MNIDWQRVVLNIRSTGIPVPQIAKRVGMDPMTLGHYARGECDNPRWLQAVALLDVHTAAPLPVCPGVAFDPFVGSGTAAEVAQTLGRDWIACELNEAYEPLQRERVRQQGMAL